MTTTPTGNSSKIEDQKSDDKIGLILFFSTPDAPVINFT